MGRWIGWGCLALALLWWWMPERVPAQMLPQVAEQGRTGQGTVGGGCPQGRCVVVYVAPWCGACRQAEPMIKDLRDTLGRDGIPVQVVTGMDRAAALETHGRSLGYPVLLDEDGRLQRAVGVRAVPSFVVLDKRGRVEETVRGAYPDVGTMRRKLGV